MKKKVLALVVLAAMLVSILPMAAFAAGTYSADNTVFDGAKNLLGDGVDEVIVTANLKDDGKAVFTAGEGGQEVAVTAAKKESGAPATKVYTSIDAGANWVEMTGGSATITVPQGASSFLVKLSSGDVGDKDVTIGVGTAKHKIDINGINSELSRVIMDTDSAKANGAEEVEFDILLMGLGSQGATQWKADATSKVFVASSRGALDQIATTNDKGKIHVVITSVGSGTGKIAAGLGKTDTVKPEDKAKDIEKYLAGETGYTAMACQIIPASDGNYTDSITFNPVNDYAITGVASNGGAGKVANGSQYYEITATVTDGGYPVSGKEVTFSVNKSGAVLTAYTATTNSSGQAKVKITATKPGSYTVNVASNGEDYDVANIVFDPATVSDIKAASDDNQKIAFEKSNVTLKYNFYDANGNKVAVKDNELASKWWNGSSFAGNLAGTELQVITKPSGSNLKADNITAFSADNDSLKLVIDKDDLDKEGDYEIKLAMINGKAVTYKFNVKKQGAITGMTIKYDTTSLSAKENDSAAAATTDTPSVKLIDAEGYGKDADFGKLKFTVDNSALADISSTGIVTVASTNTGSVTVTAIDTDSKQVATAAIAIVKVPATLSVTGNTVAAGTDSTLTIQLVDIDGQPVAFGSSYAATLNAEAVILSKPADAIVSCDSDDVTADAKESGKFTLALSSNKEGEVKVQVILTSSNGKVYTGSTTVTFGKDSGITGNDIIFMIGASSYVVDGKPVASTSIPFIENGRTYLGIRDMGMAMGIAGDANIVWDQAAQTAKLVKDGITVEVTVGATAIKVTKDNVTTEVAIDAPAQNKDGRVYLPFCAVFEAFGYSVEYANGTITCGK